MARAVLEADGRVSEVRPAFPTGTPSPHNSHAEEPTASRDGHNDDIVMRRRGCFAGGVGWRS